MIFRHSCPHRYFCPRPICRNVLEDFCCIKFGGFSRGFSWRIFLGTFSHKNEEKKSGEKIREKKSGGSKIKIREKSVLPKAGPKYFTPNYTFAFAFLILKVINSVIILFRFALISVSMVRDGKSTYTFLIQTFCPPPHPKAPMFFSTGKSLCASSLGKERQEVPTQVFFFLSGGYGGLKRPKPAILGHKKFSLLFFFFALIDPGQFICARLVGGLQHYSC